MRYNFIAIEGTIGAGKTTLATKLAEDFNGKLILEQFADNPFLPKFYQDQSKYSFPLELSFLAERYNQLKEELSRQDLFKSFTISDYLINKSLIFAKKTLEKDELTLFNKVFDIMNLNLPKPDLLVYLFVSVERLKTNIIKRGRPYEQSIKHEYLEKIQSGYIDFMKQQQHLRILVLDTNSIDFVSNQRDYNKIVDIINQDFKSGLTTITL